MNFAEDGQFLVRYAVNIPSVCEFYQALGIEPTDVTENLATVSIGGHEIHFVKSDSEPFEEYKHIPTHSSTPSNDLILYVESSDIDADYQFILDTIIEPQSPIITNQWGAREFLIQDPSGLNIALYQML